MGLYQELLPTIASADNIKQPHLPPPAIAQFLRSFDCSFQPVEALFRGMGVVYQGGDRLTRVTGVHLGRDSAALMVARSKDNSTLPVFTELVISDCGSLTLTPIKNHYHNPGLAYTIYFDNNFFGVGRGLRIDLPMAAALLGQSKFLTPDNWIDNYVKQWLAQQGQKLRSPSYPYL